MTSLEKKLSALNNCKKRLDPYGSRTQRVRNCVSKVETAFADYIKSDNVRMQDAVTGPLTVSVEEHTDFQTAVKYINSAIRATENAIAAEKKARQEAQQK